MATKKKVEDTEKESLEAPKTRLIRRADYQYNYIDNFRVSYSDIDVKITTVISELLADETQLFTETGLVIMSPLTAHRLANTLNETLKNWEADTLQKKDLMEDEMLAQRPTF